MNTALSALEGAQYWKQTLDLFTCDQCAGLQRDVISYNSATYACSAQGAWVQAAQLVTDAMEVQLDINTITYNGAIRAHCQASRWQATLRSLFVNMRGRRPEPDMVSYEAAVNSCETCGKLQQQASLLYLLEKRSLPIIRPDSDSCS